MFTHLNSPSYDNQFLFKWLSGMNIKLFGTLIFNKDRNTVRSARLKLSELHNRVDRKLLGISYYKKPIECRTLFIAFFEHIYTNLHSHLLIVPPKKKLAEYVKISPVVWEKLCPSGEFELQIINSFCP